MKYLDPGDLSIGIPVGLQPDDLPDQIQRLEQLWAWRKVKAARGGKLLIWQPRVRVLGQEDFTTINQEELT